MSGGGSKMGLPLGRGVGGEIAAGDGPGAPSPSPATVPVAGGGVVLALKLIALLASLLLFSLELIAAKALLPRFGGSYLVWSLAVMFFQGVMIAGYGLVHVGTRRLGVGGYFRLHLGLVLLSLVGLWSLPGLLEPALTEGPFVWRLVAGLGLACGPVFLMLSTLGVATQRWLAASNLPGSDNPYALYGVSNFGAFLALLGYPILVEPHLGLSDQLLYWRGGYLLVVALQFFVFVAWRRRARAQAADPADPAAVRPGWRTTARWFLLIAAGNVCYLAATNLFTMDLAAAPFLWAPPLAIFLISFALAFKRRPWYPEWLRQRFYLAVPVGLFLFLLDSQGFMPSVLPSILFHLLVLFVISMVCQGELYRARPADPAGLTGFYLVIAVGGFAGSLLVGWLIPALGIPGLVEYPLGLLLVAVGLALGEGGKWEAERLRLVDWAPAAAMVAVLAVWPRVVSANETMEGKLLAWGLAVPVLVIFAFLRERPRRLAILLAGVTAAVPLFDLLAVDRNLLHRHRNHYGIYRVFEKDGRVILKHGSTFHGAQHPDGERAGVPQLYYHPTTPVGRVMGRNVFDFKNIALVGLGTGSLAAYGRPGQRMDFFELDPDGGPIARRYFTYLDASAAEIRLIYGDARLTLAGAEAHSYDLLVIDAFNSDSIPVHLLTLEALAEYRRVLTPDGLILFHVSNRYLDLAPVLFTNGQAVGARALFQANPPPDHPDAHPSQWGAMTWSDAKADRLIRELLWRQPDPETTPPLPRPWSDDFTDLFSVMIF